MKNQLISVLLPRVVTCEDRLLSDCCFETVSRESHEGHVNNLVLLRVVTREDRLLPDCCFETVSRESQEG